MDRHYIELFFLCKTHCVSSLFQANRADIVTLDAGEVYSAVRQFDLVAIAKEIYSDGRCASHFFIMSFQR